MQGFQRPTIIISSTGRTGTQFLGDKMRGMIGHCHSIHEADVLWVNRPGEWLPKIRRFGLYRMTLGKVSARSSLRALAFARITGRVNDRQALEYIRRIRAPYMESTDAQVFLEANGQYTLLIDLLPQAFPNSKTVHIVRDPRDWARSWMNMENAFYSLRDTRSWLLGGRLKPKHFPDDPYRDRWRKMNQFERLCWLWQKENGLAVELATDEPQVRVLRFEQLFTSHSRDTAFREMLVFVTDFPNGDPVHWEYQPKLLEQKVHSRSEGEFPAWRDWSPDTARRLHDICGPLMERLGYGDEAEWQALIAK